MAGSGAQPSHSIRVLGITVLVLVSTSVGASAAAARTRPRRAETRGAWPARSTTGSWGVQATAASARPMRGSSAPLINVGFNFPIPQALDSTAWTIKPLPAVASKWSRCRVEPTMHGPWAMPTAATRTDPGHDHPLRSSSSIEVPSGTVALQAGVAAIDAISADDVWGHQPDADGTPLSNTRRRDVDRRPRSGAVRGRARAGAAWNTRLVAIPHEQRMGSGIQSQPSLRG